MEKTTVFNLIILDESGSMCELSKSTIAGCNETLNVIRLLQEKHADTQRNLVSIYVFQSGNPQLPSRYICKNVPIDRVANITSRDYRPWGGTPLLDAVGSTLVDLRAVASTHVDATASVTIITDGYENTSARYSYPQVKNLIAGLKEMGWNFNFIGANIDVAEVAKHLDIDNTMSFEASAEGNQKMWNIYNDNLINFNESRIDAEKDLDFEKRIEIRKSMANKFFKK